MHWFWSLFSRNTNAIKETIEVFRPNAEASQQRAADSRSAAQMQFAKEFMQPKRSWFDAFIDGLNRLPRPAFALGTLWLFTIAMTDPVWFTQRMAGLSAVPDALWVVIGGILAFYFGGRFQAKSQEFRKSFEESVNHIPHVIRTINELEEQKEGLPIDEAGTKELKEARIDAIPSEDYEDNAALMDWGMSK